MTVKLSLAEYIQDKIYESKAKKRQIWPVNSNRASLLGHPCLRYLVYQRTHWQEKTLPDVELQFIFDEGHLQEKAVLEALREAGFDVIEEQKALSWPKYNITGKIDGKIIIDGKAYPIEVKSMSPYIFDSINTLDNLKFHKYHHIRGYYIQMNLYLLLEEKEKGFFILKNKSSGQIKVLEVELDYDVCEEAVKKAEQINKHVAEGTLPERIEYQHEICGRCEFRHICLPEQHLKETVNIKDDPELEGEIERYMELKPYVDEWKHLDKALKKKLEGQTAIIGKFYVSGKWIETTKYNIPNAVKEQYAVKYKYWKRKIEVLDE